MGRTCFLIIIALFSAVSSVNGQTNSLITEGEALRISIDDLQLRLSLRVSRKPILVQYISSRDDTLFVYFRNDKVSLPLSAISRIERRTDKLRGNAGGGAIIGGLPA